MDDFVKSYVKSVMMWSMIMAAIMALIFCFDPTRSETLHLSIGFTLMTPVFSFAMLGSFSLAERLKARQFN